MPNPFSAWVIREKDETATEFSTPVEVHVPSTPVAYDILNDPLDAESEEEASVNAVIDATPILKQARATSTRAVPAAVMGVLRRRRAERAELFADRHPLWFHRRGAAARFPARPAHGEPAQSRRCARCGRATTTSTTGSRNYPATRCSPRSRRPRRSCSTQDIPTKPGSTPCSKHATIAGVDNPPGARGRAVAARRRARRGRFSVNIMFQNAGKTETITTIEHAPDSHVEHRTPEILSHEHLARHHVRLPQTNRCEMETMDTTRALFKVFVANIDGLLPAGPDKTYVLRQLRDCAMWANIAITRNPDGSPRT